MKLHFIELGVRGIKESLDRMLALDYLIANEDRHFNNFGVIRDSETMEFIGPAPIFDSGTSMWYEILANNIYGDMDMPSKPFESKHSNQIKLVTSFDWFNKDAMYGIEDEWNDILSNSTYIDVTRRDALVAALKLRVNSLDKVIAEKKGTK